MLTVGCLVGDAYGRRLRHAGYPCVLSDETTWVGTLLARTSAIDWLTSSSLRSIATIVVLWRGAAADVAQRQLVVERSGASATTARGIVRLRRAEAEPSDSAQHVAGGQQAEQFAGLVRDADGIDLIGCHDRGHLAELAVR